MNCIITGFDPFDGADSNPSQLAVERLPRIIESDGQSISISNVVLATCCDEAWTLLQKEFAALPGDCDFVIILAGVAAARTSICLERFALNVRQYRILDNRGHQWHDEYIHEDGPDALRTTVELNRLIKMLEDKGHMVDVSNYAGAFVCNETYYRAMHKWQTNQRCRGILFVHLPPVEVYKDAMQLGDDQEVIDNYSRALQDIVIALTADKLMTKSPLRL